MLQLLHNTHTFNQCDRALCDRRIVDPSLGPALLFGLPGVCLLQRPCRLLPPFPQGTLDLSRNITLFAPDVPRTLVYTQWRSHRGGARSHGPQTFGECFFSNIFTLLRSFSVQMITRWRYFRYSVMITRWRYCLIVAMITRWHYYIVNHQMSLLSQ